MLAQTGIFAFGMTAVYLANDPRPRVRRFASVCGLLAQPFWYYESFTHGQWGIFFASVVYSYSWGRGFYHAWIKR